MPKPHPQRSRLDHFLHVNQLKPSHVSRTAGCSRQHLLRLRGGKALARISTAVHLAVAYPPPRPRRRSCGVVRCGRWLGMNVMSGVQPRSGERM